MKKLFIVIASLFCGFVLLAAPAGNTQNVNLAWDYDFSTNAVSGFRLYYGPSTGNYTNSVTVGTVTNATIPSLSRGGTYYFAATALSTNAGIESDYSNEINYTIPKKPSNPKNLVLTP